MGKRVFCETRIHTLMNPLGRASATLAMIAVLTALSDPARPGGAFLGVAVQPVGPTLERQLELPPAVGLLVERVAGGSPADRAGILPHDILIQLGGQLLFVPEQLDGLLRGLSTETPIVLELIRAREKLSLELALVARQSTPSEPSSVRVTVMRTASGVAAPALADFIQSTAQTQPSDWTEDPPLSAYLGLRVGVVTPAVLAHLQPGHATGAVILAVAPGSPAESASLEAHDIIVQADHRPILQPNDLFEGMRTLQPEAQLLLTVLRQNKVIELPVRLAAPSIDPPPRFDRAIGIERRHLPPLPFAADAEWLVVVKPLVAGSPPDLDRPTPTEPPTYDIQDADLTIRLEGDWQRRRVTITDSRGSLIFRGGITTPADRLQMPPNVWARVADLIDLSDLSPRTMPQLESDQLWERRVAPDWL